MRKALVPLLCLFALAGVSVASAAAPACRNTQDFSAWLADFRQQAAGQGISARALRALDGVTLDPAVLKLDRNQRHFRQSFEQFSRNRISPGRVARARSMLERNARLFARVEQKFGVPKEILVAIWAMETDFGANMGNRPVLRSLATLAYDCRRSELFTTNLLDALRVIDRGDLAPAQMKGAWAGELGQTQFMASSYYRYGVDFDGDGRANLIASVPDVIASTANFLRGHGWRAGGPWGEGSANFAALREWNRAEVYAKTIAAFADRLAAGS